jgi:hypothetical protein
MEELAMKQSTSHPDNNHMNEKREELIHRREQLITRFASAARSQQSKRTSRCYKEIGLTNEFLDTLDQIAAESVEASGAVPRYVVSSWFLHDCFKKLTIDRNEQLIYITGPVVHGIAVLDQSVEIEHDKRTMVGVSANTRSTHRLLIHLEKFGHRLLGHFHSHPGNGADATHPSGIDEQFQRRLEAGGHQAVAAIFSRDGFVRFLRMDSKVQIEIYGQGVEQYAENVYRLTEIDPA